MKKLIAIISSIHVAIMVSVGTMLLWLFLWGIFWTATKPRQLPGEGTLHALVFDDDGYPVIRYRHRNEPRDNVEYRNLAGELVKKPQNLFWTPAHAIQLETLANDRPRPVDAMTADQHLRRVRRITFSYEPSEEWFLVHDGLNPGGCWFEAHQAKGAGETVFIAKNGESRVRPARENRFPISLERLSVNRLAAFSTNYVEYGTATRPGVGFLAAADHVYQVSLEKRQCHAIATTPAGVTDIKAGLRTTTQFLEKQRRREQAPGFTPEDWLVVLRTGDSLILMDGNGGSRQEIPIPAEFQNFRINLRQLDNGETLLDAKSITERFDSKTEQGAFFDLAADRSLTNRRDYSFVNPRAEHSELANSVMFGIANPTPVLAGIICAAMSLMTPLTRLQIAVAMTFSTVSGILGFWLCLRHQATRQDRNRRFWLVYSALFGVFGYIGYRWHRTWPDPRFSGLTPASFETPEPNGLEIFAWSTEASRPGPP